MDGDRTVPEQAHGRLLVAPTGLCSTPFFTCIIKLPLLANGLTGMEAIIMIYILPSTALVRMLPTMPTISL